MIPMDVGKFVSRFGLCKKEAVDYKLNFYNNAEYEILVSFKATNRVFEKMFRKTVKRVKKLTGADGGGNTELIERFDVDPMYYNLIGVAMADLFKQARLSALADGFKLLNKRVKKASFRRDPDTTDDWLIDVVILGDCSRG